MTVPLQALCAAHDGVPATATCTRCGTFLCDACRLASPANDAPFCQACVDRLGGELPGWEIPWETQGAGLWWRLGLTIREVLTSPRAFFDRMPKDGWWPPILFNLLVSVLSFPFQAISDWLLVSQGRGLEIDLYPATTLGGRLVMSGLTSLSFPIVLLAVAVGAQVALVPRADTRTLRTTFRAAGYVFGAAGLPVVLLGLVPSAVGAPDLANGLGAVTAIVFIVLLTVGLSAAHRIGRFRAFLATVLGLLATLGLFFAVSKGLRASA